MTDFEGDNIDFSDINLPNIEALDENAEPAEVAAQPIKPEIEPTPEQEQQEVAPSEPKPQRNKQAAYIEWAVAATAPVIMLVIAWIGLLYFSTAIYLIAIGFVPYGLWKGREMADMYTIFLGCTLIAVLTGAYFMWAEFGRYQFDVKAHDGKRRVSVSQTVPASFCRIERNVVRV